MPMFQNSNTCNSIFYFPSKHTPIIEIIIWYNIVMIMESIATIILSTYLKTEELLVNGYILGLVKAKCLWSPFAEKRIC